MKQRRRHRGTASNRVRRAVRRLRHYHPKHPKGRAFVLRFVILTGGVLVGYVLGEYLKSRAEWVTISLLVTRGAEIVEEAGADVFAD